MSRVARNRPAITVYTGSPGYRQWWYGSTQIGSNVIMTSRLRDETMSDSVGPSDEDGPLDQRTAWCSDPRINGTAVSGVYKDVYVNFGVERDFLWRLRVNTYPKLHVVDWATLALRARASLNPNTSTVDVPTFVAELRDIPELYRYAIGLWAKLGRRLPTPSGGAEANLVAQFGVLPVLNDVLALFDFAEAVRKREEHLRRLANGNERFSRRLDNYTYNINVGGEIVYQTRVANITAPNPSLLTCKRQAWFTARASAVIPSAGDIPRLAREVVLGVHTLSAKQVYDLIPWSWLIDYFTNVGNILAAYRGGIEFNMGSPTIMVKDSIGPELVPLGWWPHASQVYAPPPIVKLTYKRRKVQPISPVWLFKRPYLTTSQWSILASLLVVRSKSGNVIAS